MTRDALPCQVHLTPAVEAAVFAIPDELVGVQSAAMRRERIASRAMAAAREAAPDQEAVDFVVVLPLEGDYEAAIPLTCRPNHDPSGQVVAVIDTGEAICA